MAVTSWIVVLERHLGTLAEIICYEVPMLYCFEVTLLLRPDVRLVWVKVRVDLGSRLGSDYTVTLGLALWLGLALDFRVTVRVGFSVRF